jgi:hypothetical protein
MNLHPLEYITPSSFFALSNCFLQAAFRVDASYVTFQPPAVRLGTACHALLERVAKGALIDCSIQMHGKMSWKAYGVKKFINKRVPY